MADGDDARNTSADDGSGAADPAVVDVESPLARRWQGLDRGWQALSLGLVIVAAHGVIYAV